MSVSVFVDTNVLVYARDTSEADKQPLAEAWMRYLWRERSGRLSYQVLQEFYVTVTAKLDPGMETDAAREEIRALLAWRPIPADSQVFEGAWRLQDRYAIGQWDSLIVAGAAATGSRFLLTEDLQHHQDLGGVTVLNPFVSTPAELSVE